MIQAQSRPDSSPLQMNIIIRNDGCDPERRPLLSKKELARRINVTDRTIQHNIRELEEGGLGPP